MFLAAGSGSVTFGTTAEASGCFCRHRRILPDGFWGCRRIGSETAAVSVQPFLRFESLWLLRKRFGAEVLVAGILIVDFGSRRKGLCDAFELWNLCFEEPNGIPWAQS
nr:uncharacterized protein LOC114924863 [Arachis hypogaea]